MTPRSKLYTRKIRKPTGETTRPTRGDMKKQPGELTNKLHWFKNIHIWFTQKHRNGWVTFKKNFKKNWISHKIILKGLESKYTNHQINNAVKNQIYPKKSQYIIWFDLQVSLLPRHIYPLSYVIRNEQICKIINISWCLVSLDTTVEYQSIKVSNQNLDENLE